MKKIFFAVALILAAVSASAQTAFDAYNFSKTNYSGTARSMAVGNAMTALGGDLGSVVFNPAGSAVFNHSVVALTPSITISTTGSSYSSEGSLAFGPVNNTSKKQFTVPNLGVVLNFELGDSGVKGWSFSFLSTQTDNFQNFGRAVGRNSKSSLLGSMAYHMYDIDEDCFTCPSPYTANNHPRWDFINAYRSYQVDPVYNGYYIASNEILAMDNEGYYYNYVPDVLSQSSEEYQYGTKNDLLMNTSINIDDFVYVGASLGIPLARYRYTSSVYEAAVNPENFPVVHANNLLTTNYFKSAAYTYNYAANYDGIYAKIGAIVRPVSFLRFGLAFQTPTTYTINESWNYAANVKFDDSKKDGSASSPDGEYSYCLRSPYVLNAGVALTLGNLGFISADYEMSDYSIMRFRERHGDYNVGSQFSTFGLTNDVIKNFYGVSHSLRLGAEMRLGLGFAVRAGYGFITSPELERRDSSGDWVIASDFEDNYDYFNSGKILLTDKRYKAANTNFFSFGFGYSSKGSFFADVAAKRTTYPTTQYLVYDDYAALDASGKICTELAPKVQVNRSLWNVSFTFGWRF